MSKILTNHFDKVGENMKCKGTIKYKTDRGKIVVRKCGEKLSDDLIFCPTCGTHTGILAGKLSAKQNWSQTWQQFKKNKSYPFSIFYVICILLPILLIVLHTSDNYWLSNAIFILVVPLALVPFGHRNYTTEPPKIADYFQALKFYPYLLGFVFLNSLYFLILKIVCTGFLLNIVVDPILHIVRFILVLYWLSIVLPAPLIMLRQRINPLKAILIAHRASKEIRWQLFLLLLYIGFINALGALALGLGLLVTIPLSFAVLEKYYLNLEEVGLVNPDLSALKEVTGK